jgi:hypothetical protein
MGGRMCDREVVEGTFARVVKSWGGEEGDVADDDMRDK